MMAGKVSILVPSRNETFLVPTVRDLLAKARGDVELIVITDGYFEPGLPDDPRVRVLHFGDAQGMRPGINAAARIATGTHLLKCDAHTLWAEGYDVQLLADYAEDNWVLTLRRYALDAVGWQVQANDPRKYPIDYHYLSYPYAAPDSNLHGVYWRQRRDARAAYSVDEEMTSQGSAWFMSRAHWERIGPLDVEHYGTFINEFQEIGLRTWLGGGAGMVTKNTWYAHLYKGKTHGRGYTLGSTDRAKGQTYTKRFWMRDEPWPGRQRSLRWLIERFWPVPGWPADVNEAFRPHDD